MDINKFIFSRTTPKKKIETVRNLSKDELLSITPATIIRIVKETGTRLYRSRDKELLISHSIRTGNDWNSEFEGIRMCGQRPLVCFYIQYENTDTNTNDHLESFLQKGDYRGSIYRNDRHGNKRTYYFTYSESDKAECVRSLLLEHLDRKYKDRL